MGVWARRSSRGLRVGRRGDTGTWTCVRATWWAQTAPSAKRTTCQTRGSGSTRASSRASSRSRASSTTRLSRRVPPGCCSTTRATRRRRRRRRLRHRHRPSRHRLAPRRRRHPPRPSLRRCRRRLAHLLQGATSTPCARHRHPTLVSEWSRLARQLMVSRAVSRSTQLGVFARPLT
jgi:hypothetical protein